MLHEMGYAEALRRIAECKDGRHEKLDLGGLGLKSVPEELFELNWLRKLNLGRSRVPRVRRKRWFDYEQDGNSLSELPNDFSSAFPYLHTLDLSGTEIDSLEALAGLKELVRLECSGTTVHSLEPLRDLRFLKKLNCSSTGIENLLPLKGHPSLATLTCANVRIASLEGLENLPQLKQLVCSTAKITNLEPLRELPKLERLTCSNTSLESLEPLRGLPNLARLNCRSASLANLEGLENLPRLARLDCSGNRIANLEPLRNLPSLTRLDCTATLVSSLEPLSGLPSLKNLVCDRTGLKGLQGLEKLPNLVRLSCAGNEVADLQPLKRLSRLTYLNCTDNPLGGLEGVEDLPCLRQIMCYRTRVRSLNPLAGLRSLEILNCSSTPVESLEPLRNLPCLKTLGCSETQILNLTGLENLLCLKNLNCNNTNITDLNPLRGLPLLTTLDCYKTGISSLEPLRRLPRLKKLDCANTSIRSLESLADVPLLTRLNCSSTHIDDLAPLAGHLGLKELWCQHTRISSLEPLKDLPCLSTFYCAGTKITILSGLQDLPCLSRLSFSDTKISDLRPLRVLQDLTYLDCSKTRVTSLEGIEGLSRLISLECQETPLTSLEGVEGLKSLEWLDCSDTKISSFDPLLPLERLKGLVAEDCGQLSASPELWLKPSLVHVELFGTKLHGVPDEVLSEQNCIYELAAHCADLGDNPERLSDVKLMVLGNGRVGKTQLVRRLQGRAYQDNSDSTHGIMVESTPLPIGHDGETVPVKIWDFGGQDIYHATHALFYRTRAIFLICWHPDFENEKTVDLDGFRSRNHELPYWLKHVQHCADSSGAVLVAQTRCDREGDGEQEPYGTLNALKGLGGYVRHDLKTSAATGLGLDALVADLKEAYAGINPPLIGPGRAQVKRLLEERLARIEQAKAVNGGDLPEVEKALRTLTVEEFKSLCEDAGQISDPDLFLKFLHDAGVVFWQEGLLHDRIVLDQNWALEAIYALFNRDHCVARLREAEGRFTAADVGTWLWDRDFSFGDQQLFLAMMKSCGICFHVHDGVYIAPEFLPEEPPHEVRQNWPGSNDFGTVVQIFEKQERVKVFHSHLSTRTLIRSIICVHGPFYGIKGAYWATGIQFVDEEFGCIGMIEYTKAVSSVFRDQDEGDSTITIRVRPVRKSVDGSLELFFERLCNGVRAEADQLGIEIW